VSFDPNLRPRLWPGEAVMRGYLNHLAGLADWVLPGLAEGRLLTGLHEPRDIAGVYLDRGAKAVVVKLGPAGAYLRSADAELTVPGVPVEKVVDTVGAGDGFAVGFISACLDGLGWAQALQRANWIGAQAVQTLGDVDGLPTRARLSA
jgi:sugar/nucleoside kinase (ribokinase family)